MHIVMSEDRIENIHFSNIQPACLLHSCNRADFLQYVFFVRVLSALRNLAASNESSPEPAFPLLENDFS